MKLFDKRGIPEADEVSALASQLSNLRADVAALGEQLTVVRSIIQLVGQDTLTQSTDPRAITAAPGQVYSQNNEDGILAEIFSRIGTTNRRFVEIGVGNGIENNTRLLLDLGWSGVWFEGDTTAIDGIRTHLRRFLDQGALVLVEGYVTREAIAPLIDEHCRDLEPDLLSLDIDYNTSHVWAAMPRLKPRVVCIEYNAHFPPSIDYEVPYDPEGRWDGTTRFGASLKSLERIGGTLGYSLVGCDPMGVNAFFLRNDLCSEEAFLSPFTAEAHYQPPRFGLVHMRGHRRFIG